jgi:biotin carboxyl carrier protein
MILEAMKMENDIVSPCDGKITSVIAKKGDSVNSSDVLATVLK